MLFDFISLFLIKFSPSNSLLLFSFTKILVCKRLKTYEVQYISRDKAAPGVGQLFLCSVYTHSCADIIKTHFLNSTQMPTTSKHISSAQTSPLNSVLSSCLPDISTKMSENSKTELLNFTHPHAKCCVCKFPHLSKQRYLSTNSGQTESSFTLHLTFHTHLYHVEIILIPPVKYIQNSTIFHYLHFYQSSTSIYPSVPGWLQ